MVKPQVQEYISHKTVGGKVYAYRVTKTVTQVSLGRCPENCPEHNPTLKENKTLEKKLKEKFPKHNFKIVEEPKRKKRKGAVK